MKISMARWIGLFFVVAIIAAAGFVALTDWREKSPEPARILAGVDARKEPIPVLPTVHMAERG